MRPFEPADQDVVFRLINAGLAQRFGTADESLNPDIYDIQAHYVDQDAVFLVVEDTAGVIIGCGALIHENGSDEIARIVRVSVREDHQGRGLGRKISMALLDEAREKGYQRVLVETNADWTSALCLYKSLGFTEDSRTPGAFDYTEVNMSLNL